MRRRAFLTTVWAGLLAGCSTQDETSTRTTGTTYGYGGTTVATETAVKTGEAVTTATTSATPTSGTTTKGTATTGTGSAEEEYGEQGYGTHEYGG